MEPHNNTRKRLSNLLSKAGELFTVEEAANILALSPTDTAKTLARWCNQGWLARIKRGLYTQRPIESLSTEIVLEDPFILVPELFNPAYIGGWSAAHHFELTDQLFRDICIFTAKPVTMHNQTIHNVNFVVNHAEISRHFGNKVIWSQNIKIAISDPSKTIIDMLHCPTVGGGIQHTIDCFLEYIKSKHFDHALLLDYAKRMGNGAVFKRLGYLSSLYLGTEHALTTICKQHISKGKAQLDPAMKGKKLITRWQLFVPEQFI